MSQQLVQKKADVLIGIATPAAQALANTTQEIPIILGAITDPVSAGLVKDNQKPGVTSRVLVINHLCQPRWIY